MRLNESRITQLLQSLLRAEPKFSEDSLRNHLRTYGKDIREALSGGIHKFLLQGDLGAGKSSFVSAFLGAVGYPKYLGSPTYPFAITYRDDTVSSNWDCVHMDLYRLKSRDEFIERGLSDLIESTKTHVFIEWPERMQEFDVEINLKDPNVTWIRLHFKEPGRVELTQLF